MKLVYITLPNRNLAAEIAKTLVQERLAACVNIAGAIESHYIWEDQLTNSQEILIFAKTTDQLLENLITRVKALHPYTCPCIIAMNIENGNPDFLQWIKDSCS